MRIACLLMLSAITLPAAPRFQVSFEPTLRSTAADGRLIIIVAKTFALEPRAQVVPADFRTQQIFGVDVNNWKPAEPVLVDATAAGSPLRSLQDLPPGTYNVQAVLNLYETFHRSDGHTVKLHMDQGEGQHWNNSPGNLYSKPQRVTIDADSVVSIGLTEVIPPIKPKVYVKNVRHVRVESALLTKFWGRAISLGAVVIVPEGFDDHPELRYPIAFLQGHYEDGLAFYFYNRDSARLPRILVVITEHATPYFDDSYGVNSANTGPYGDALTQELYPYIERQFRAIGEPWARVVFGGSTGGWMSLAQQIFYPDYFGGAWGFCPDPVDFHAFQMVDVYGDKNAYYDQGPFARVPKLIARRPNDHIMSTVEQFSRQEAVLGGKGRSGSQMDAFHATFGPVDADGYPAKLWDSETGNIDPEVAKYWTEHYDLTAILERNWKGLGPKLVGKLHITMGTKDTYFLDAAAHRMESFLESTKQSGKGPYYGGSFDFGNNEPHCYTGKRPEGISIPANLLNIFADYMRAAAPAGADAESWR